jgi:hypothetical protein
MCLGRWALCAFAAAPSWRRLSPGSVGIAMSANNLRRNGKGREKQPREYARLRQRIRALMKERRALKEERDSYLRALMEQWKKESRADTWEDFDPKDYRYTLADIFAEFEKEQGVCLPRNLSIRSSTRAKSRKDSRAFSNRPRKSGN